MDDPREKWSLSINTVSLGGTGDRKKLQVGGEGTLPFLAFESRAGRRPAIAGEVLDRAPQDWPESLDRAFGDDRQDPARWAAKYEREFGVDAICLKLDGLHPDRGDGDPAGAAETVAAILEATSLPLIVYGCGEPGKDNIALPLCSQAAAGRNCLIGPATEDNYKTPAAACLADGHKLIARSPIDINIAKQVNILISEMGFNPADIIIDPMTGGLGYGIEYTYSIMERIRLAALAGDKMLAMPMICDLAGEVWKVKEARGTSAEHPAWGDENIRGPAWEAVTAALLLQAGGDILVMRHPSAIAAVRKQIGELTGYSEF